MNCLPFCILAALAVASALYVCFFSFALLSFLLAVVFWMLGMKMAMAVNFGCALVFVGAIFMLWRSFKIASEEKSWIQPFLSFGAAIRPRGDACLFALRRFYPEFVEKFGNHVPDFRGQFLRGVSTGKSAGQKVGHTFAAHTHAIPAHTHTFQGQLTSASISGVAAGQLFSTRANLPVTGTAQGQRFSTTINSENGGISGKVERIWYVSGDETGGNSMARNFVMSSSNSSSSSSSTTVSGIANSSTISGTAAGAVSGSGSSSTVGGSVSNGKVTGAVSGGAGTVSGSSGNVETAPDHIYVRYIIRMTSKSWYPEFVAKYGATVPDFRGYFLRGQGGKSGALNVEQKEALYLPKSSNVKLKLTGLKKGLAAHHDHGGGGNGEYVYRASALVNCSGGNYWSMWQCRQIEGNGFGSQGNFLGEGDSADFLETGFAIETGITETRPTNKAVKYIIKARWYPEFTSKYGSVTPDYRGYFLRGIGGNSAALGVAQGDAIRNIIGYAGSTFKNELLGSSRVSGPFFHIGSRKGYKNFHGNDAPGDDHFELSFDVSRVVPTANEIRSINKAVKYIIKTRWYPEFRSKFGANAPDYRGYFLRGQGGKSGVLGAEQKDNIYLSAAAGAKLILKGIGAGKYYTSEYREGIGGSGDGGSDYGGYKDLWANFTECSNCEISGRWNYLSLTRDGIGIVDQSKGMEVPITINSGSQETRPINKAVKYIIKARWYPELLHVWAISCKNIILLWNK